MKSTLLFTFLCSGLIFAQDKSNTPAKPEAKTKIELFQSRKGGVIIKSFQEVFKFQWYYEDEIMSASGSAEVWELIDGGSGEKAYGIKITMPIHGGRFGLDTVGKETVFLDADEVDAVIKGIDYILSYKEGETKYKDWQIDFKSKAGFEVSAFSSGGGTKYAVDTGRETRIYPRKEIEGLKVAFTKAKGLLGE